MKCTDCQKRMRVIISHTRIAMDNMTIVVRNVPVLECPVCGKRLVHDMAAARVRQYVQQYGAPQEYLDFAQCEQTENEDVMVVMQLLHM